MRKRRIVCCVVIVLSGMIATIRFWPKPPTPPTPGVTVANCERLRPGMPLDEVKAILGPPTLEAGPSPGESSNVAIEPYVGGVIGDPALPGERYYWWSGEASVSLTVDASGRVLWARFMDQREDRSTWHVVRARLGW
jgi:hypothetical protein